LGRLVSVSAPGELKQIVVHPSVSRSQAFQTVELLNALHVLRIQACLQYQVAQIADLWHHDRLLQTSDLHQEPEF
jgi:hypothetical protein